MKFLTLAEDYEALAHAACHSTADEIACGVQTLGERLATVRRVYGESIDLADLGKAAFATLLGISPVTYDAYERGESEPTFEFLMSLWNKTGVNVAWILARSSRSGSTVHAKRTTAAVGLLSYANPHRSEVPGHG